SSVAASLVHIAPDFVHTTGRVIPGRYAGELQEIPHVPNSYYQLVEEKKLKRRSMGVGKMKFRCDRDALSEALQIVQRGISARPGIPALTGVLMDVAEGGTL